MKKTTVAIIALLLLGLVGTLGLLKRYELDLVEGVVVNTMLQKAPSDYPAERITTVFQRARQLASGRGKANYLEHLLRLSQRLEKIQSLSRQELEEILEDLSPPSARTGQPGVPAGH